MCIYKMLDMMNECDVAMKRDAGDLYDKNLRESC